MTLFPFSPLVCSEVVHRLFHDGVAFGMLPARKQRQYRELNVYPGDVHELRMSLMVRSGDFR